jgi:hypothetical protein
VVSRTHPVYECVRFVLTQKEGTNATARMALFGDSSKKEPS